MLCVVWYAASIAGMIVLGKSSYWMQFSKERRRRVWLMFLLANTVALGVGIVEEREQSQEGLTTLERNDYGNGTRTENYYALVEGEEERIEIPVQVPERSYTKEQIEEKFQEVKEQLESYILGENASLDAVTYDLNLIRSIPDEPIQVNWTLDSYQVLNSKGKIQEKYTKKEGTKVELRAVLRYEETEQAVLLEAMVYPPKKSRQEQMSQQILEQIDKENEKTAYLENLTLPETIHGKKIRWFREKSYTAVLIVCLSILIGLLYLYQEKEKQKEQEKKKKEQMLQDYPNLLNQFALMLGAGMTVKRCWNKIVRDYQENKEITGIRYVYEEMEQCEFELRSGILEAEVYERFAKRCSLPEYLRFSSLLSQNLRKGTKGLRELLALEAVHAFEERKTRARKKGEEASTKLLLPLFLMLGIVLIIVIVPAFWNMGI